MVKTYHNSYSENMKRVKLVRNVYNGIDYCLEYIEPLSQETVESINKRRNLATLKNFIKRAINSFNGTIYRKPIKKLNFDDKMLDIFKKIDKVNNLDQFAKLVTTDLCIDGKVFIGIDTARDGSGVPYSIIYKREEVINWRFNIDRTFKMVVIKQYVDIEIGEFGTETIEQYKVYKDDGTVDIYRNIDDKTTLIERIETGFDLIPIICLDLSDIPILYDEAKLNIKHLNTMNLKDKYLRMCAVPIPVTWGVDKDNFSNGETTKDTTVTVGAEQGFNFSGTKDECDFKWVELTGNSIDKLQDDLLKNEQDIITGIIRGNTDVEVATIKTATQSISEQAESTNRVSVIAYIVEIGLNEMVHMIANLGNIKLNGNEQIILNKDFNYIASDKNSVRLVLEGYLAGTLSYQTYIDSLNKAELIDVVNADEEIRLIENETFKPISKIETEEVKETLPNTDNNTISKINV